MASKKKTQKKSEPKKRGTKMCPCPSVSARKEFKEAKTCSSKRAALEKLKSLLAVESVGASKGTQALITAALKKNSAQTDKLCKAEEFERSESARFNGLGRIGRRRRRRH